MRGIPWLAENQSVSEEGLCSMEWLSQSVNKNVADYAQLDVLIGVLTDFDDLIKFYKGNNTDRKVGHVYTYTDLKSFKLTIMLYECWSDTANKMQESEFLRSRTCTILNGKCERMKFNFTTVSSASTLHGNRRHDARKTLASVLPPAASTVKFATS
jgi:hypothetical protein